MNRTLLERQRKPNADKGTITGYDGNQKLVAEIVKSVWDAGYKEGLKDGKEMK